MSTQKSSDIRSGKVILDSTVRLRLTVEVVEDREAMKFEEIPDDLGYGLASEKVKTNGSDKSK